MKIINSQVTLPERTKIATGHQIVPIPLTHRTGLAFCPHSTLHIIHFKAYIFQPDHI